MLKYISLGLLLAALTLSCSNNSVTLERPLGVDILDNGDYLVTDGGGALQWDNTGSKVFIMNKDKQVKWVYDKGLAFAHSAIMLKNGNVLIPDTNNNRIIEVSPNKDIVWSTDDWTNGLLEDESHLDYPNHVVELDNGNFLVSDRDSSRVLEINRSGKIFGVFNKASRQHAPRALDNGNVILADSEGNRVIEVDPKGEIVWEVSTGLKWPRRADRLSNGNTLITDSKNNRIIEVTTKGAIVTEYKANFGTPYEAQKLENGNILVCDSQHSRLLEVNNNNKVVWEYHNLKLPKYPKTPIDLDMEMAGNGDSTWYIANMVAHNPGTWEVDKTKYNKGTSSLKISTNSKKRPTKRWWGQKITVTPGDKINMFCSISTELEVGGAGIAITWLDSLGGSIGGVNSKSITGTSKWTTVTLPVVAPEGAKYAEISLSMVGRGSAWFDSIEFGSN